MLSRGKTPLSIGSTLWGVLALLATSLSAGKDEGAPPDSKNPVAAWAKIAGVLQHPRCLNCHQEEIPLQGDARRVHVPLVIRGPDNHGVGAMRCGNCHNNMGNNPTSRTPGAPNWQLAPVSMLWQGMPSSELCRMLKDPKRNGNRSLEALVKHMDTEPLVLWGWNPGAGRAPVPVSHELFVDLMKAWVAGGAPCPT